MKRIITTACCIAAAFAGGLAIGWRWQADSREQDRIIGGVERVTVKDAALEFAARIDSGATVSSINARAIEVIDGDAGDAAANLGKQVRFTLVNAAGEEATLQAPIKLVRPISTADCLEWRYHVYLNIGFRGRQHRVLFNLNDRSRANERLLLGRNWLRYGYVVDLSLSEPKGKG